MTNLQRTLLTLLLVVSFGVVSNAAVQNVTNLNDSGAGSLRQAIADANVDDTIQFAENLAGGTINLDSEIAFNIGLNIIGPASDHTTISGGDTTRIFNITGGNLDTVIITGLRFANGFANQGSGGAIRIAGPSLELNSCIFDSNRAFCNSFDCDASGAAVDNRGGGNFDIIINYTTFINNSSECFGDECDASGAAFDNGGGGLRFIIDKSAFISNSGTCTGIDCDAEGAALDNGGGGVSIEIHNSTFALNSTNCDGFGCDADGGAIENGGGGVTTEIHNTTFDLNSTSCTGENCDQNGASIGDLGDTTLSNTIFNTLSEVGNCDFDDITSLGYNIDNGSTCIDGSVAGDKPNTNPFLDPQGPRDNGGPTPTVALLVGSPAIDMGSPNCPPPDTDQRGFIRPEGPRCDIGAFEGSTRGAQVPTLSEWGLIAMAGVLGLVGFMVMRRKIVTS